MTNTAPIVRLYDLDTAAYDICPACTPSGFINTAHIYGTAFFNGHADGARFYLILKPAALDDMEPAASILFDDEDQIADDMGFDYNAAEAALLAALRSPGFINSDGRATLYREFIDNYLPAIVDGAGSTEHIRTASGWCFFAVPSDEGEDLTDVVVFEHYHDESPAAIASDCADWGQAETELRGYVPDEALQAVRRWHYENKTNWADVRSL